MKNIQIIDDAVNCTYSIFAIDDDGFEALFPNGTDVAFESEIVERLGANIANPIFDRLWQNPVDKKQVNGIHGSIYYGEAFDELQLFYPSRREAEMLTYPQVRKLKSDFDFD